MKKFLLVGFVVLYSSLGNATPALAHKYPTVQCASGATCNVTITAPASGATLIAFGWTRTQHLGGASNDCTTGISTTAGANSFINITNVQWDTVNHNYSFVCYAKNVTNGPTTVIGTPNATISDVFEIGVVEVTGLDTSAPLDQSSNNLGPGCAGGCTGNTAPVSASTTTTVANEYLFCNFNANSGSTTWSAPTNSFTIEQQPGGGGAGHSMQADRIVSSTLTTTCGATQTSAGWDVAIATFKQASAGGVTRRRGSVNEGH